jgi:hypothetical protein
MLETVGAGREPIRKENGCAYPNVIAIPYVSQSLRDNRSAVFWFQSKTSEAFADLFPSRNALNPEHPNREDRTQRRQATDGPAGRVKGLVVTGAAHRVGSYRLCSPVHGSLALAPSPKVIAPKRFGSRC